MNPRTIPGLYHERVQRYGDRIGSYFRDPSTGKWHSQSWADGLEHVKDLANGLYALGVQAGDRVGILSETRIEWVHADLSIVNIGAITVGVYATSTVEQTGYILQHAGVEVVFVEDWSQYEKVKEAAKFAKCIRSIVLMEDGERARSTKAIDWQSLLTLGQEYSQENPEAYETGWKAIQPDALAMLVYTSGTTGPPKGVMLTHKNIYRTIEAIASTLPTDNDLGVVFLPLSHSLQRVAGYAGIYTGGTAVFAERLDKIVDHMREFRPTVQASVPRIYEKIHTKIRAQVEESSPAKQKVFQWALDIGLKVSRLRRSNKRVPLHLVAQHQLADKLVLSKIRDVFGGNIRYMLSGAAPIAEELLEFFHACGVVILEGYGLTETTAPTTVNRLENFKFGTVGQDLPICKTRIAEDGEILIKGDNVFAGYWKDEKATQEAFTEDGWFKSGDVGEKDRDGFLRITDRKKEILITAAGKNVSPANVEKLVRAAPLISQCVVHGDRSKYLVALITLEEEEVFAMADRMGLNTPDFASLLQHPSIVSEVQLIVDRCNRNLARYETIKYFRILSEDLSVENDLLTPTLKLKRRNIREKYADLIAEMYEGKKKLRQVPVE